jgi:hypothetical protein
MIARASPPENGHLVVHKQSGEIDDPDGGTVNTNTLPPASFVAASKNCRTACSVGITNRFSTELITITGLYAVICRI